MSNDRTRAAVVVGCTLFFLLSFPADFVSIREGLGPDGNWQLSLGLTLKTTMVLGSIVGLSYDKTIGYAFLLGACLQILLIRSGDFLAVLPAASHQGLAPYTRQLTIPTLDTLFRLGCLAFLISRRNRLVGRRGEETNA